jgi:SAM-dependent methyltransferase
MSWKDKLIAPGTLNKRGRDYYRGLHGSDPAYIENNWLLRYKNVLIDLKPQSILEVGCGNAKFLEYALDKVPKLYGIDWAISSKLITQFPEITFLNEDIRIAALPKVDLVCSADVMEHIHPDDIEHVLKKLHSKSDKSFHVIACYNDGHSHLTIMPPDAWLELFNQIGEGYTIRDIRKKQDLDGREIVVITRNI